MICITTKFSGSYNSAVNARNMLLEDYPDAKIEVIDSTLNTVEEGIFVREAARMKAAGLSLEESVQALERIKSTGRIIFTVGSLDYLIHGGRIGKVLGGAVNMLGIKPMIVMQDGEIFSSGMARGERNPLTNCSCRLKSILRKTTSMPMIMKLWWVTVTTMMKQCPSGTDCWNP